MTARTVRRVLRPQNLAAILGLGLLSVVTAGLIVGAALPMSVELVLAAIGIAGGTTAVIRHA